MVRYYDGNGNLVDAQGHDILDEEELADLDEVRYIDEEDDYDEDFEPLDEEWDDDFDLSLEYDEDFDAPVDEYDF